VQVINEGGKNVVPEVWEVLDRIKAFSNKVCVGGEEGWGMGDGG
jgi:hypothetical protein